MVYHPCADAVTRIMAFTTQDASARALAEIDRVVEWLGTLS